MPGIRHKICESDEATEISAAAAAAAAVVTVVLLLSQQQARCTAVSAAAYERTYLVQNESTPN